MKKLIIILISLFLFISCESDPRYNNGLYKENEVRFNKYSNSLEYVVWVFRGSNVIHSYRIPFAEGTQKRIDSLNYLADNLLKKIKYSESLNKY